MFGALARELLPKKLGVEPQNLVVVSIMPCTAKKFEARRPEFASAGQPDVDFVLTTQELSGMIREAGLDFSTLEPESLDLPFGFYTGAGVIFGVSGGVSEAVLRLATEKITGQPLTRVDFQQVRGEGGLREATVQINGSALKLALVHGLANAKLVAERVKAGKTDYDLIEVMACPGGCIGGAGQPLGHNGTTKQCRAKGLYAADKQLPLHKAQENPFVQKCYEENLGEVGGKLAHQLLHTHYQNRGRSEELEFTAPGTGSEEKLVVQVCAGTACFVRGAQKLLHALNGYVEEHSLQNIVDVRTQFCSEHCSNGPTVHIGDQVLQHCTFDLAKSVLEQALVKH
jgi:NADH-quinone oxidoreductase subunit G